MAQDVKSHFINPFVAGLLREHVQHSGRGAAGGGGAVSGAVYR